MLSSSSALGFELVLTPSVVCIRRTHTAAAATTSLNTTIKDVAGLQEVSGLIQKGDYDRACMYLNKLDTAVRDEVPSRLYESIYRA